VTLTSDDTGEIVDAPDPQSLPLDRLPLLSRLVRHFGARGLDVRTRSESPVGAGIAGSSALTVAIIGALAAWTGRTLEDEAFLTLAMNIEAQVIGVPTGVQDFRPAFYGGVSAIEMSVTGVRRVPLAVDAADLGRRLVLAYTGATRDSGINNWDVMKRRIGHDPDVIRAFNGIRNAATALREAIEQDDWRAAGDALNAEWDHRRLLAPGVSTPHIDTLLQRARDAGAVAGKVCGAGGGGCLFCLTPPTRQAEVTRALESAGAQVLPFAIERDGLRVTRS
jgi:D-glycero-alpha-D-manno-heptose-7-phosphate kinase